MCFDARGNGGNGICPTLTGDHENRVTDYSALVVMATGQRNAEVSDTVCPTLNANHEQPIGALSRPNKAHKSIRRLTPLECCRLQGFPDAWSQTDKKDDLSEAEYTFWLSVRNSFAAINGRPVRQYSKAQMIKWYNGLHTDTAEYRMWGNGVVLPCAVYVLDGIARVILDQ